MKRVLVVLFLFGILALVFTGILAAEETEKIVIEEDMAISEDTTWAGDVIINEGVTLIVRDCSLTVEQGKITNYGSFLVENGSLVGEKQIRNHGMLEIKNSTVDVTIWLYKGSILIGDSSKLRHTYFLDDDVRVEVSNCEIYHLACEFDSIVEVVGRCKIEFFDILIRISGNANVTYINDQFSEESRGYVIPEVTVSSETEMKYFGYGMKIQASAKVIVKDSQLLYLDAFQDTEVTLENCNLSSDGYGTLGNYGAFIKAEDSSFRRVRNSTIGNSITKLVNCTVSVYVKNNKGTLHLINTKVVDTFYEDRTLNEGERLP